MARKLARKSSGKPFDTTRFINVAQIGGIEAYSFDNGPARGTRALCFNTGGGLRFRVLLDRGMDIDQAFFHQHSLAFLSHQGPTPPTRALDRGIDWLKAFPGGLLTSCGPFNTGGPVNDGGEELGLHGQHSTTAAMLESIVQPDPQSGRLTMGATALLRYGRLFGPCLELRRTITSNLASNRIDITDAFYNAGNTPVPHAWLLHINFGYPLLDEGTEFQYNATVESRPDPLSQEYFAPGRSAQYHRVPGPLESHQGFGEVFAYLFPKADRAGNVTVAVANHKLGLSVAIHYNANQFPRCGNWQHWGHGEYVAALEPMNGGVEGRDKDRQRGWLDSIRPGGRKVYQYALEIVTAP